MPPPVWRTTTSSRSPRRDRPPCLTWPSSVPTTTTSAITKGSPSPVGPEGGSGSPPGLTPILPTGQPSDRSRHQRGDRNGPPAEAVLPARIDDDRNHPTTHPGCSRNRSEPGHRPGPNLT